MENKHAYLIMAHNQFDILEKLILLLDDIRNDIYIHIDKKVNNFKFDYYKTLTRKSNLFFIERIDTRWGDFSLVQCELELLKKSIENKYKYYHLISGVDLPIKTQDEIHKFFSENDGIEYIHFCNKTQIFEAKDRVEYYYLMKYYRHKNRYINYLGSRLNTITKQIQQRLKIKRSWEDDTVLNCGSQWFSITHELAKYIIDNEKWINKFFNHTFCSDEMFIQTLVYNSKFRDRLYIKERNNDFSSCLRYIDWERGGPYTFKINDFEDLINSDYLFARKFSSDVDNEIVEKIFNYINNKNKYD